MVAVIKYKIYNNYNSYNNYTILITTRCMIIFYHCNSSTSIIYSCFGISWNLDVKRTLGTFYSDVRPASYLHSCTVHSIITHHPPTNVSNSAIVHTPRMSHTAFYSLSHYHTTTFDHILQLLDYWLLVAFPHHLFLSFFPTFFLLFSSFFVLLLYCSFLFSAFSCYIAHHDNHFVVTLWLTLTLLLHHSLESYLQLYILTSIYIAPPPPTHFSEINDRQILRFNIMFASALSSSQPVLSSSQSTTK